MAYGYYSDPGNTFGNTGQTNQNETFIQRQQRLQQGNQQQAQPKADQSAAPKPATGMQVTKGPTNYQTAAGGTGTPVSGNGGIPAPTPTPAPAPAAPAAPAPPPPPPPSYNGGFQPPPGVADPFQGRGVYDPSTGSWVPGDHPAAAGIKAKFAQQNPQPAAAAAAAGPAGPAPVGQKGSAEGGAAEASKSGMFTQYAAPEHDFQNWQQLDLVSKVLANPETMTPDVLNKMKQKSMEEALLFQQQQDAKDAEDLASRGFTAPGGLSEARKRKTAEAVQNAILGQNRDFEVQAAQQNRQDQLQALGTAEAILGGQVGRSSQVFNDILAGQQANRGDHWTGEQLKLQRDLGQAGINIDQQRVNASNKQFDASHGLDILRFLEGQRQFNGQNGLGWAQLNQNGQNATMDAIMRALGK